MAELDTKSDVDTTAATVDLKIVELGNSKQYNRQFMVNDFLTIRFDLSDKISKLWKTDFGIIQGSTLNKERVKISDIETLIQSYVVLLNAMFNSTYFKDSFDAYGVVIEIPVKFSSQQYKMLFIREFKKYVIEIFKPYAFQWNKDEVNYISLVAVGKDILRVFDVEKKDQITNELLANLPNFMPQKPLTKRVKRDINVDDVSTKGSADKQDDNNSRDDDEEGVDSKSSKKYSKIQLDIAKIVGIKLPKSPDDIDTSYFEREIDKYSESTLRTLANNPAKVTTNDKLIGLVGQSSHINGFYIVAKIYEYVYNNKLTISNLQLTKNVENALNVINKYRKT